jgi:tetratricopeptide (TPR) repeat protein
MESLLEIYPDFADAYFLRSAIKIGLNDYFGANADRKKAVEISEKNNVKTDSMKYYEGIELMKLTDFTGDFISMSEKRKLVQYQEKDIRLKPFLKLTFFPDYSNSPKVCVYAPNDPSNYAFQMISLIMERDSVPQEKMDQLLKQPDSLQDLSNANKLALKQAVMHYSAENYLQALTILNRLILNDHNEITSRFTRANIMLELLELVQNNDENYRQIINSFFEEYSQQEDFIAISYENVMKDYNKIISLDPEFVYTYYNRAYLKYLTKDFNGAIDDFWHVIRQNPGFSEAYYNRGLILIFTGERALGCEDIRKAGELGITDSYNVLKRYCPN